MIEFVKHHFIKIFTFFKNINPKEMRLWVLDSKIQFEELQRELFEHLKK